jgi:hypothetical protein
MVLVMHFYGTKILVRIGKKYQIPYQNRIASLMSEGYAAVLLLVDICTGFVFLRLVKDYTASEPIHSFLSFVKSLHSDVSMKIIRP